MKRNGFIFIMLVCTFAFNMVACAKKEVSKVSNKKVEGVEGKIFYIDDYRSFAFTKCGIVSSLALDDDSEGEMLGIWEHNENSVECHFADGSWETFTYNQENKEIVSQGGTLVASGQVFEFLRAISTTAPFVGKQFGAAVAPAYFSWQFYDCGIAKVTSASEGLGETDIGVYYYDADTSGIYVAGDEIKYNEEKQRINTYDTSVSDLQKDLNPVTGKTFTFTKNKNAKAFFTDCGILAFSTEGGVLFYDYSCKDDKIVCYPMFVPSGEYDAKIFIYDANANTIQLFIEPPSVPYSRDLRLKSTRMNGDDVKQLQEVLIYLDYLDYGEDDGYFGPKTEAALKEWQGDNGFTKDGIMSQAIYNAIFGLQ